MSENSQNQTHNCPICNSDIAEPQGSEHKGDLIHRYSCQRCGDYCLDSRLNRLLPYKLDNDLRKMAVLSHWIRTKHESISPDELGHMEIILLNEDLVDDILKHPPPAPGEQADNIIRWLGENMEAPGESIWLQPCTHQSIMGAITPNEFEWVLWHLIDTGILQGTKAAAIGAPGRANVTLSFEGCERYEDLKRGTTDSRKAFMAMQYGESDLDKIVEEVFKPAVKQAGFDLVKLDEAPRAGLIDDRLRVEIQTSRFLIADLTHENRGAYWEAGYAEGLGKPVIYTCEKQKFEETETHFDTNHHLTVVWDPANPQEAAEKLKATIRATLPREAKLTDD